MQLEPIVARRPQSASVTGRLTLPDGRPVANATVRASSAGEGFRSFGESVEVDTVATADLHLPLVRRR